MATTHHDGDVSATVYCGPATNDGTSRRRVQLDVGEQSMRDVTFDQARRLMQTLAQARHGEWLGGGCGGALVSWDEAQSHLVAIVDIDSPERLRLNIDEAHRLVNAIAAALADEAS